jgi:hypothetical protein
MIPREFFQRFRQIELRTNRVVRTRFFWFLSIVSGALLGCSTAAKQPAGLPVRYHDAKYDFLFFLPADWNGHSVLMKEWHADLHSTDYQAVIGREHGPIILLRHPQWKADQPHQDIPILVFTRDQWEAVIPQRLFVGAGGTIDEISHSAKYVFAINSRHNWTELEGWQETGRIVQQNMTAGRPHLVPDSQ